MTKRKSKVLIDSESNDSDGSVSDLDTEFMNLAKKKRKEEPATANRPHSAPSDSDTATSDSDSDWDKKNAKKKAKVLTKKMKKSKASSGSEKEDGEMSEREEGEVDESDSEEGAISDNASNSDATSDEFNDGYDDNLMGDAEDQARLARMTEIEREQELFKRIEQREVMKTRFDIEKKLRLAKKKELRKNRDVDRHKVDAKQRSKDRKKTVEENKGRAHDKKAQAMNALKARREEKKERAFQAAEEKEKQRLEQERLREEDENAARDGDDDLEDGEVPATDARAESKSESERSVAKKLKASDIYSDDSGSSSESEGERKRSRSVSSSSSSSESDRRSVGSDNERSKKPVPITTKEDLHKMKLSRHKIERWVHTPFFNRIAKGCFVRIGIGNNNGKPIYRVAEVADVVETGKIYQLGNQRTNSGFRLRHGLNERVFRLEFISNQEFSESEFQHWKDVCLKQNVALPTIEDAERKTKELAEYANYEFKEEDIEKIVKEKERFKKNPHNYAMRKTQLMKERDLALSKGEDDVASKLSHELRELEERAEELDKLRTSSISSISYINERNRKKNVEEAEKAILEEIRANKGKKVDDPFTRRSTKPRMIHKSVDPHEHMDTTVSPLQETSASVTTPAVDNMPKPPNPRDIEKTKIKPMNTDDLFSAHNFDIKIDLGMPLPSHSVNVAPRSVEPSKEAVPRRSLNLEDYKKKRGLI